MITVRPHQRHCIILTESRLIQQVTRLLSSFVPLSNGYLSLGNVYIGDRGNNRIRKVTVSTGIIDTIAGMGPQSYSGDNGPATSATLNYPDGVAVDTSGTHLPTHFVDLFRYCFPS